MAIKLGPGGDPLLGPGGDPTDDANCCCVTCVDICTGSRPASFDIDVPHDLFFQVADECSYDTGTGHSPYGGAFNLQILGGITGEADDCYWYYCGDDPCNTGKKFVWVLGFNVTSYRGTIYYGVDSATCDRADIIAAINLGIGGGGYTGNDNFDKAGPGGDIDCCTISYTSGAAGNGLFYDTSSGTTYVTLKTTYYIGFNANC